jgi:hypothetical protein
MWAKLAGERDEKVMSTLDGSHWSRRQRLITFARRDLLRPGETAAQTCAFPTETVS